MRTFPFPDRIESREELKCDTLYRKIPSEKLEEISNIAWNRGVAAAQALLEQHSGKDIWQIAQAEGLTVLHEGRDNVAGSVRYFSEYFSARKEIVLYVDSVRLWARANSLELKAAEELILSHEMYHHMECTTLGLTSDLYRVPWIRVGKITIGKCGIRALSEIGAHGFSRTYYEGHAIRLQSVSEPLHNCAVNVSLCENRRCADQICRDNAVLRFLSGRK